MVNYELKWPRQHVVVVVTLFRQGSPFSNKLVSIEALHLAVYLAHLRVPTKNSKMQEIALGHVG
jgi:hypothetical protein